MRILYRKQNHPIRIVPHGVSISDGRDCEFTYRTPAAKSFAQMPSVVDYAEIDRRSQVRDDVSESDEEPGKKYFRRIDSGNNRSPLMNTKPDENSKRSASNGTNVSNGQLSRSLSRCCPYESLLNDLETDDSSEVIQDGSADQHELSQGHVYVHPNSSYLRVRTEQHTSRLTSPESADVSSLSTSRVYQSAAPQCKVILSSLTRSNLKEVKRVAKEAAHNQKVFTVLGPYHRIRMALRTRGWVEKFDQGTTMPSLHCQVSCDSTATRRKRLAESHRHQSVEPAANRVITTQRNTDVGISQRKEASDKVEFKVPSKGYEEEYCWIMSRMLRSFIPNFIWSLKRSQIDFRFLRKNQMVNHHLRAPFTTKIGLCRCLRQLHWIDGLKAEDFFPRCYVISDPEDRQAFLEEFRLTACTSLLKLLCLSCDQESRPDATDQVTLNSTYTESSVKSPSCESCPTTNNEVQCSDGTHNISRTLTHKDCNERTVSTTFILPPCSADDPDEDLPRVVLEMAVVRCLDFIYWRKHQDIDRSPVDYSEECWPWKCFFAWCQKALRNPHILRSVRNYRNLCHKICMELRRYRPQHDLDGVNNVWIVKPAAKSRGRGVVCYNRIDDFLHLMQDSVHNAACRFVAQKYVEKPLLIYKTKFDIRQWFLVTDWSPLTVWWYRTCYLRFCSREFTLDDFSEAIHLCNNSIQGKYIGTFGKRELSREFMWTLEQFQTWLTNEGHGERWQQQIEPSMKRSIIDSLLCAQEEIEARKNSFALYGADFMLTEDFKLWLIEINSSPCMSPSTAVTAKLTSSVLEDTLKVVIDRRSERNCDTGQFELVYRQDLPVPQVYTGLDLRIEGTAIRRPLLEVTGCPKNLQNAVQPADKPVCILSAQTISSSEPSLMIMQSKPHRALLAESYYSSRCLLPNIASQSAREDKLPTLDSAPCEKQFTPNSNLYHPSPQSQTSFGLRGSEVRRSEQKQLDGVYPAHHTIAAFQSVHLSLAEVRPIDVPKGTATRQMTGQMLKKMKLPERYARSESPMSANYLPTVRSLPSSDTLDIHDQSPRFMSSVNATTCKSATAPIADASQERRNSLLPRHHVTASASLSFSVRQGNGSATELKNSKGITCSSFRLKHQCDPTDRSGGSELVQDVPLSSRTSTRQVHSDECSYDNATRFSSDSNWSMRWIESTENPKRHQISSHSRASGDQPVKNGANNSVEIRGSLNLSASTSEYCQPKRTAKWNINTGLSRKVGGKTTIIKTRTNSKSRRMPIKEDVGTAAAKCADDVDSDTFKLSPSKMDSVDDESLWEMAKEVLVKSYRLTVVDEIHGGPKSSKKQRSINKPATVARKQTSQKCTVTSGVSVDGNIFRSTGCRRASSVTLRI